MNKKAWAKLVALLIVAIFLLLLLVQNASTQVQLRVLWQEPQFSLSIVVLVTFILGYIGGIATILLVTRGSTKKRK